MAKVAMVSGANRGIGLAIARELKAAGYQLSLGVRRPALVPVEVAEGALLHQYNAADRNAAKPWVANTFARFSRIDVLVNNAGIAKEVRLEDGSDVDLDDLFEINVKAPFRVTQAALPHLIAAGEGRVVNVASLSGKRVLGLNAGYQMSKHALVALTHATRRVGWEHGIRATALCPGWVLTDMARHADYPHERMSDPADLAKLVRTIVELPNTASVAELLVNSRFEAML